ncbi:hypothetical protein C8F04DRAFT_1365758 [Mycena alexandri]|uniref:Uncharacterized protein n=1 Tax=Mycena alexandri TaxID=1745969 RepID=A0AAD6SMD1_9AGAR|nr:hypothetical protein C8F04DRAFT_1341267 [Mycena alexandri]KAJ7030586.1 hypothetical protein C8F04DRAFT_1365758 [Mycena alexandri]
MSTLSQIHTFLKAYFGDTLSRILAWFSRSAAVVKPNVEARSNLVLTTDGSESKNEDFGLDTDTVSSDGTASTSSEVEPAAPNPDGPELLSEAVAVDLEVLPSLTSIFKFPAVRSPVDMPALAPHRQDFGPPSGLYYDRRFPLGNVTNVLRNTPMKLQTEVQSQSLPRKSKPKSKHANRTRKEVNWSLPTGVPHGRRSRSKHARPLHGPEIPVAQIVDCAPSSIAQDAYVVPIDDDDDAIPAPGSVERNSTKAALLAQVRSWSDQVKASRRHSLRPIPAPSPGRPVDSAPISRSSKRNSAPAVLVASTKAPRLDLQDLLSALVQDATDTIAALDDKEQVKVSTCSKGKQGGFYFSSEDMPAFSAVALEEGHTGPALRLISSISASRSMAALAHASSRSLSDLLDTFDEAMASPRWRRLLSRSDDIARRRNDSD